MLKSLIVYHEKERTAMIKSMTGFGRGESVYRSMSITAEIKSVNHRYCEITVKLPRRFNYAEESIKNVVKKYTSRGKIEVNITVLDDSFDAGSIHLNVDAAKAYYAALNRLNDEVLDSKGSITLQMLSSNPDVLKSVAPEDNEEEVMTALCSAVVNACESFNRMRAVEGKKLVEDILSRGQYLEATVSSIEEYAPEVKRTYYEKLRTRIADLLDGNAEIPEDRIALEAAMFADKVDITEEITRLKSHFSQLRQITDEPEDPVGKKLDFLVQEMNRETNTIGSKCNDISITNKVLAMKNEIEKIREQIQNIE